MSSSSNVTARWRTACIGAGLSAGIGLLLGFLPWGESLALRSYDIPFAFRQTPAPPEVVVIYLDEHSYDALREPPRNFNRHHHARLLEHLTRDGAKLVVFDIYFGGADESHPGPDQALTAAMQRHRKVVLLGESAEDGGLRRFPPWEGLRTNAAGWGIAPVRQDLEIVVRQFDWRRASDFALPWVAASRVQP